MDVATLAGDFSVTEDEERSAAIVEGREVVPADPTPAVVDSDDEDYTEVTEFHSMKIHLSERVSPCYAQASAAFSEAEGLLREALRRS